VSRVLIWLVIALFFAVVLNPAVEFLVHRGRMNRGLATLVVFVAGLAVFAGLMTLFISPLITEGQQLAEDLPAYVEEARAGRGPVGSLVERFDLENRIRERADDIQKYVSEAGSRTVSILGAVGTAIAALLTILVMTVLMLLDGPRILRGMSTALPDDKRDRITAVAGDCARAVTGYMAGNLLISVIAGTVTFIFLLILGVPFAGVLALLVAVLDLIPLVGATIAAIIVTIVAFFHGPVPGIASIVYFVVYQQFENHVLQPVVQSRTVKLAPLVVLVSVIMGVEIAGVLGALLAIPVAGVVQVVIRDLWEHRTGRPKAEPSIGADEVPLSQADAT
ncbi:MAG: AI-2E family transporter, partial [Aldersonia sp.]|nr:AI-2E family transporter [Aldersonia sp.]